MTKKDYKLIAHAIKMAKDIYINDNMDNKKTGAFAAMIQMESCIAGNLQADNPKFDRVKFISACLSSEVA
jgi:hypothetical protein